jgi:hypothetical protein
MESIRIKGQIPPLVGLNKRTNTPTRKINKRTNTPDFKGKYFFCPFISFIFA